MIDEGAVLFWERPLEMLERELQAQATALGYRMEEKTEVSLQGLSVELWSGADGSAVRLTDRDTNVLRGLALALAGRVARSSGRRVRALLASVTVRERECDCALEDVTMGKDGARTRGRWATDLEDEFGSDWTELCDGKPYAARTALMERALELVLPGSRCTRQLVLEPPPSLGASRLDDIARRARFAERAVLTTVAGRRCVRITSEGATVSSFVDEAEAQRLADALGALLAKTP